MTDEKTRVQKGGVSQDAHPVGGRTWSETQDFLSHATDGRFEKVTAKVPSRSKV